MGKHKAPHRTWAHALNWYAVALTPKDTLFNDISWWCKTIWHIARIVTKIVTDNPKCSVEPMQPYLGNHFMEFAN